MCDIFIFGDTDLVLNLWSPKNNYLNRLAKVAVDL